MKDENLKFEELLAEISRIARALEEGDLSLEDAIKQFERGTNLLNQAKAVLDQARMRIEVLTRDGQTREVDPENFLTQGQGEKDPS